MKLRQWLAVAALIFCAAPAMAQDHWVTGFLNRYRPRTDASVTLVPATNDQALRSRLQDGTLPLTVDELIRLMLQNSLDVTYDRFNPLLNYDEIALNYSPFEPYLSLSANVTHTVQPQPSQLSGAATLGTLSGSYSLGFQQYLPTGTSYGASIGFARTSSNNSFNTFNPYYNGQVTYSISQQLLQNRGSLVNLKPVLVQKNNKKLSDLQFEYNVIQLVASAENNYWNFVFAQKQIDVATHALELAQKLVHDDDRQIEIGTMAPMNRIQAEALLAQREYQKASTSYQSDQIQDQIKRLLTNVPDAAMVLTRLTPIDAVPKPGPNDLMPISDAIKFALENRVEMREMDVQLANNDLDVMYTKNQLLPSLSVNANYYQFGIGGVQRQLNALGSDTNAIIVSQGGLGDAFGQLFGFGFTGYNVGFKLQIPLSNKPWEGDNARALTSRRTTVMQKDLTAQQIAVQVRNAESQVQMAQAQITTAQKAYELAQQSLDADTKLFQLGTLPAGQLQLINDQQNLTSAETNEIQAFISYAQAMINYDMALGRTLQRHNIEIQKEMTASANSQQ